MGISKQYTHNPLKSLVQIPKAAMFKNLHDPQVLNPRYTLTTKNRLKCLYEKTIPNSFDLSDIPFT